MMLKLIRYVYSYKCRTSRPWRREAPRDNKELPRAVDNERDGHKCLFVPVSRFAVKGNFRSVAMDLQNIKLSSVLKKLLYDNVILQTYLHRNIKEVWNCNMLYGYRWPKTLEFWDYGPVTVRSTPVWHRILYGRRRIQYGREPKIILQQKYVFSLQRANHKH
jgi:hypothetical protein